jgi:FkbM family methyltransferase
VPPNHKLKTALYILRSRGVRGVFKTLHVKLDRAYHPNETQILYQLLSENGQTGVMVDVGAGRGASLAPFAENGWLVVAFEPDSTNRSILTDRFSGYPNVQIDPRACSDMPHPDATLFTSKESTGVSSLSPFLISHIPSQKVNVTTLSVALSDYRLIDKKIAFLKIDTEGYDLMVMKGYPWSSGNTPEAILCEFEDAKTIPLGYRYGDLVDYLLSKAYHLIISEWYPIKTYGGLHHWCCFTAYPYTLKDARGWGNIMAIKDDVLFEKLCYICNLA